MNILSRRARINSINSRIQDVIDYIKSKYVGLPANYENYTRLKLDVTMMLDEINEISTLTKEIILDNILRSISKLPRGYHKW